jgi:cytochrome c biogenesis protein
VKAAPEGDALRLEYAGLARGEDPTIRAALDQFVQRHRDTLDPMLREQVSAPDSPADGRA